MTEVNFIMELLSRYLTNEIDEFNENNVQVRFIGSRKGLPEIVQQKMEHAIEATKNNTGIILNLAINYGRTGRNTACCAYYCGGSCQRYSGRRRYR